MKIAVQLLMSVTVAAGMALTGLVGTEIASPRGFRLAGYRLSRRSVPCDGGGAADNGGGGGA